MEIVSGPPRKRFRWAVYGPGPIVALILGYAAYAAATARPGDRTLYPAPHPTQAVVVQLIDNGFHTDLAIPRDRLIAHGGALAELARQGGDHAWIALGWGDRDFYREEGFNGRRIKDGFRALFAANNPSVMRTFGVSREPFNAFARGSVRRIRLSQQGLEAMLARMEASLSLKNGMPVRAPPGYDPRYTYFESNETFGLARLCNHWTADMLDAAGLPTTPAIDGLAPGLMADLSWRAGVRKPRKP